jgi:hypothetical protein
MIAPTECPDRVVVAEAYEKGHRSAPAIRRPRTGAEVLANGQAIPAWHPQGSTEKKSGGSDHA